MDGHFPLRGMGNSNNAMVAVVVMRQNVTSSRKASIGLCSTVSLQQNDSFGFDDHAEHSSIYHTHHSLLAVNRERD